MKNATYIFYILLFISCKMETIEPVVNITPEVTDNFGFQIDTIEITIPGTFHELPIGAYSLNPDQPNIMCGYDGRNNQLEIYNFATGLYTDSIPIPREGPNSTTNISSVYYHNRDSIFVLDVVEHRILIYNTNGKVSKIVNIDNEADQSHPLWGLHAYNNNNECPIYYHQNKMYFTLRTTYKEGDYSIPVIGYYNFELDTFGALDISYPPVYQTGYFGFYEYINVSFIGETIYINFPVSALIYIYDLQGNLLKKVNPGPDFAVTTPISGASASQIPTAMEHMNHLNANPLYHRLMPVSQGRYFIQNGRYAVPTDRQSTIFAFTIVYNHDFSQMNVIERNLFPFAIGNDYFYYTLPIEKSDIQQLERWHIN